MQKNNFSLATQISNNPPTAGDIKLATDLLNASQVVALPTETVYGLAANADDDNAVQKIYAVKNRPVSHPLIIHITKIDFIEYWADFSGENSKVVRERAYKLAEKFMPGAITLILPRKMSKAQLACGGQKNIAIRYPDNKCFQMVAQNFNGLAAPSANPFGRLSPTTAQHVYDDLQGKIPLIIDNGACSIGIESTIVNCSDNPTILRPGAITSDEIAEVLSEKIIYNKPENSEDAPKVSGSLNSHYAPKKTLLLINDVTDLQRTLEKSPQIKSLAILANTKVNINYPVAIKTYISSDNPEYYAQELFANLRVMDESEAEVLAVLIENKVLQEAKWRAIKDRLQKASFVG